MAHAATIARNLGAQRQGGNWRSPCPLGCGYDLVITDGKQGLLTHCFGGCAFDDIAAVLVEFGSLDDDDVDLDVPQPIASARSPEQDARRIERALRTYAEADTAGSLVPTYIHEVRGISLPLSPVLREHLQYPHRLGIRLPVMLAGVTNAGGVLTGTHATVLRHDGRGKADLGNPEYQRETRGKIKGGVIRLTEHDPERELIIGEGIESTLSAMEIYHLPGWSGISADNLKDAVELPPAVRRIVIAADNDTSGAGQRAALEAHRRWVAEGRAVRIVMPPCVGDFNDLLQEGH